MFITVECPDELVDDVVIPMQMTGPGVRLETVETVPAGPWLAAVLDTVDPQQLSEFDLPAYLRACARMQAWAAARVSAGVAELASRPGGFGADKEVALALREPVGAAQRRVYYASRLRRLLPTTRALFRNGDLSEKHVDALIDATGAVNDPDLIGAVEDQVLRAPTALTKTATELRRAARAALTRLDPHGAEDRARAARDQADVTLLPDDDGMATVIIDAPVEQAATVKAAADAYAATCKAGGDTRRIGVLRSEGLARLCTDYLTGTSAIGGVPRSAGRAVEIGIVVGLDTALGRSPVPAEVPGLGIVPREIIAEMIRDEAPRLRLMVIDDTGRLVHRAVDAYRPTPAQIAHVRAEYVYGVGPGSQILAGRTDTDHATPYPHGETRIGNLIPTCRTWHNGHTRQQLSVTIDDTGTVTWTSVLGQTRTVTPHDYRTHTPSSAPEHERPGEAVTDDPPPF